MSGFRLFDRERMRMALAQLRHPMRLVYYAGIRLSFRLKLRRVPFLPVTLDVEPNNVCNFACPHCQVTHWDKAPVQLDPDSLRTLLDQVPSLARVKLQGMGEPLLNKRMIDMVRLAEQRGISVRFTTNGSVYTEELAKQLSGLQNTYLTVSIDAATPELFEKIRVKGKLEKVTANVRRYLAARGTNGFPKLGLWTVVTSQNLHQLSDLVRLTKDLGADGITFQLFVSNWGKEDMDYYIDPIRLDPSGTAVKEALAAAQEVAERDGVALSIHENNLLSKQHKCPWPWTSSYICSNGDVVPCCIVADSDIVKLGNVFERPFSEIWNSPQYRELRRRIDAHDLPDYCRNCYCDAPPLPEHQESNENALRVLQ